jgi:gluconolactonase
VAIASRYEGGRLNSPNDLWIDEVDGIYFTDPRYGKRDDLEQDVEAVYYIAPDGELTRVIADLVRPNGIALSPDGAYLYVVDNGASRMYRYRIEAPGKLGPAEHIGYVAHPDGMTVDREGRLYVTGREGVCVLGPDGRWLGVIAVPEQPANCTFGGADGRTLFITARTGLYAIETCTRGWHVHLDGKPPVAD